MPDYYTNYNFDELGNYSFELIAEFNGYERTKKEIVEVKDSVVFDVKRKGPTRIYPISKYEMKISILASEDYSGIVREKVPESFEIDEQEDLDVILNGNEKILEWEILL